MCDVGGDARWVCTELRQCTTEQEWHTRCRAKSGRDWQVQVCQIEARTNMLCVPLKVPGRISGFGFVRPFKLAIGGVRQRRERVTWLFGNTCINLGAASPLSQVQMLLVVQYLCICTYSVRATARRGRLRALLIWASPREAGRTFSTIPPRFI